MITAMKSSTGALSLSFFLLVACGPLDNPEVLRDSTGLEFGWDCSESSLCDVTSVPELSWDCEGPGWGRSWGRFYEFCEACALPGGSWYATNFACRPVACDVDRDCPQVASTEREDIYECVEGLCQNADTERHPRDLLRTSDASTLCYANVGRDETRGFDSPAVQSREPALREACPTSAETCVLPAVCDAR